jgi:CRP/FNR family transcriptional regulator, cyclic AMP receptor protein
MVLDQVGSEFQQRLLDRYGRQFSAGEVIFADGDEAKEAFVLHEGRVRLIKRIGAVERGLRILRPGDLFGESALMHGAPRNRTAVALEEVVALALDQETFQQVLFSNPEVGARMLQQVVRRLRDAEDQIEILMVRDSQSKVVVALLKLAQQAKLDRPGGKVELPLSPMELSTHVGMDVDTVKRVVQQLRDSGYIRIVEENVEIPDVEAVVELVSLLEVKDQLAGGWGRPRPSSV